MSKRISIHNEIDLGSMYDEEPATWKEIMEDFDMVMPKGEAMREKIEKALDSKVDGFPSQKLAIDQILTLLDKEIRKARVEELKWIKREYKKLQTFVPSTLIIEDRIKQLEKGYHHER